MNISLVLLIKPRTQIFYRKHDFGLRRGKPNWGVGVGGSMGQAIAWSFHGNGRRRTTRGDPRRMTTGARCVFWGKRRGRGVSRQLPRDPMRPRGPVSMGGCCYEMYWRRLVKRHHQQLCRDEDQPFALAGAVSSQHRLTARARSDLFYGLEQGKKRHSVE